jgi:hypothetical protein
MGEDCSFASCEHLANCSNHGYCGNGKCQCQKGWTGEKCDTQADGSDGDDEACVTACTGECNAKCSGGDDAACNECNNVCIAKCAGQGAFLELAEGGKSMLRRRARRSSA